MRCDLCAQPAPLAAHHALTTPLPRSSPPLPPASWVDELVLLETIGKGGFGMVYKGTWKGSVAAIKVMYARQHERQAMKDALEMAVRGRGSWCWGVWLLARVSVCVCVRVSVCGGVPVAGAWVPRSTGAARGRWRALLSAPLPLTPRPALPRLPPKLTRC